MTRRRPHHAIVPLINENPAPRDLLTQLGLARFGGEATEDAAVGRRTPPMTETETPAVASISAATMPGRWTALTWPSSP